MASSYKRGKRWYICFVDHRGVYVRKSSKARTEAEANRLAHDKERLCERFRMGLEERAPERHDWDDLCERYLEDVAPNHRNLATLKSAMKLHLRPAFAGRDVGDLTPGDVDGFVTSLRKKGLADSSREQMRMKLGGVFAFAVRLKWCSKNPVSDSEAVRLPRTKPKYLTPEEVRAVIAAAEAPFQYVIAVCLYLGLRKGEVAGLEWGDVDLAHRVVHVRRSFEGPTKTGQERSVPIPDECLPYFQAQRRLFDEGRVFRNTRGEKLTKWWAADRQFRRVLKRAGVEKAIAFRNTRSTWGTTAYAATSDVRFVQAVLGHTKAEMTEKAYASILPEHHLAQANRVTYGLSHNPLTAGVPKGWGTAASRKEAGVFETLEGEMQTQFGRTSSGTEDGGVAKRGRYRPPHVVSLRWPVVIGAVESFWGRIGPGSLHTSDTGGGA